MSYGAIIDDLSAICSFSLTLMNIFIISLRYVHRHKYIFIKQFQCLFMRLFMIK